MKRRITISIIVVVSILMSAGINLVNAQIIAPKPMATQSKGFIPIIKLFHIAGAGIAINPENLEDFALVRIIAGKINVMIPATNETRAFRMGILMIDDDKYLLKNSTLVNDTYAAEIYSNGTFIGVIKLHMVPKGNRIVWVGDIFIGDNQLKVYILEVNRAWNRGEIISISKKEKFLKPCEINPDSLICREKIADWCESHPEDLRCRYLIMKDEKKREEFKQKVMNVSEICRNNPGVCMNFAKKLRIQHPVAGGLTNEKVNRIREEIRGMSQIKTVVSPVLKNP